MLYDMFRKKFVTNAKPCNKKNEIPVMTPEYGGASCTKAVCTPGVCKPKVYYNKLLATIE